MVSQKEHGLHATHCCKEHGCKYGDKDCPVVTGNIDQCYYCDQCEPPNDDYGQEDEVLSPDEEIIRDLEAKLKKYKDFHESVTCLFAEGVEFMNKIELYDTFKKEWQKCLHL